MNKININTNVVLDVNPTYEQGVILYVMSKTPFEGSEKIVDLVPYTPIRVNSLRDFNALREDLPVELSQALRDSDKTQVEYLLGQGHNVILYVIDHEGFTNETQRTHSLMTKQNNLGYDLILMAPKVPSGTLPGVEELAFERLKIDIKNTLKENHVELIVQGLATTTSGDIDDANKVLQKLNIENYLSYKVSVVPSYSVSVASYSANIDEVNVSTILAGKRARYLRMNKPYLPVAGETHGLVPEALEPKENIELLQTLVGIELLQSKGYITLRHKRGLGYLFATQNTVYNSSTGQLDKRHPFIRANNVTQHLWLARQINNYLESVLYMPNNQKTWDLVRLNISKIFDRLLGDGISAYKVLVGLGVTMNTADIEKGKLLIRLAYRPINVIETIEVNILVNSATGEITISDLETPVIEEE